MIPPVAVACLALAVLLAGCGAEDKRHGKPPAQARVTSAQQASRAQDETDVAEFAKAEARADAACKTPTDPQEPWAVEPGAVATGGSPECDAVALYYGIGGARDPAGARQCALALVTKGVGDPGLYGHGVLTNIYANGDGAPRDLDRAIHYACSDGMASSFDRTRRVDHLLALKGGAKAAKAFDYCDDASSDYSAGQCMDVAAGRAEDARTGRYAVLTGEWSSERKAALAGLRRAEDAFAETRSENETDMSGTDRFILGRSAREQVHDFTVELFEQSAAGRLGANSADKAAAADRALNATYNGLMTSKELASSDISRADVRTAQRAWLKYRDAWLNLARLAWPASTDAVATRLTEARTRQLKCVLDSTDDACTDN